MSTGKRTCTSCGSPLPGGSPSTRKYCSQACRATAYRRRRGHTVPTSEKGRLRSEVHRLSGQLGQADTELARTRTRVADRDRTINELRKELARECRSAADTIYRQAGRTASVRDELATATTELSALRRNWSATSDAATVSPDVTELRSRLATLQDRHGQLVAKYQQLSEAAELAGTERRQLQTVVRQWDTLARRLYKATGGHPRAATDKQILDTWYRFRTLVSGDGRRPTTGRHGQSDRAVATDTDHRGRSPGSAGGHGDGRASAVATASLSDPSGHCSDH